MPDAAYVAIVLAALSFAMFLVVALRFPDDLRALLRRLGNVTVSADGLAFHFYEAAVEQREQRTPAPDEVGALRGFPSGRILWVDDVPTNNALEMRALSGLGVAVDVATTNDEAVALAGEHAYDLVLSDIRRSPPEASAAGLELPARLRDAGVAAPVVYYVGRADRPATDDGDPVTDEPSRLFALIRTRLATGRSS